MITEPAPAPKPSRVPLYVAGGVGLVVGALVVGVLWLTVGSSGSGGLGGSPGPVAAPAKLGTYQRFADIPSQATGNGKTVADRTNAWNARTAQLISGAYDGAAATVETYASADLQVIFTVEVVRASSPGLFVPYQDPKALGLAAPEQDVRRFGSVECIVRTQPTSENSDTPPPVIGADCQRSEGGLTVRIPSVGGDLGEKPDQVAALVGQAFDAIG